MYRGFQIKLDDDSDKYSECKTLLTKGKERYSKQKKDIKLVLENFILSNGKIDGSSLINNWFPKIHADIFISHSHKDKNLAIAFAEWLFEEFGLITFVDSCIWGNSTELLLEIDKEFSDFDPNRNTYNYTKRNNSTSHVHMMLSTALSMMIDKVECVFFLNTPNSITTSDVILKTESPWIYSELAMTQIIRKKTPDRLIEKTEYFSEEPLIEKLMVEYQLDLSHLHEIDVETLELWENKSTFLDASAALDYLYKLVPLQKKHLRS